MIMQLTGFEMWIFHLALWVFFLYMVQVVGFQVFKILLKIHDRVTRKDRS